MRCVLTGLLGALALIAPTAASAASSGNVKQVGSIPLQRSAISINFIGDTMFVSTATGVYSLRRLATPPARGSLGALPMYIWENEDIDVDPVRKRLFISRDPRGFTIPADARQRLPVRRRPHHRRLQPARACASSTSSCVPAGPHDHLRQPLRLHLDGGPGRLGAHPAAEWAGRPIFATDVRDPATRSRCPDPIDTGRNDGVTDYAHDVQVDAAGVAWVSGAGRRARLLDRAARHRNPVTGKRRDGDRLQADAVRRQRHARRRRRRRASCTTPGATTAPAGDAGQAASVPRLATKCRSTGPDAGEGAASASAWHARKPARRQPARRARARRTRSDVLLGTEENVVTDCATVGPLRRLRPARHLRRRGLQGHRQDHSTG